MKITINSHFRPFTHSYGNSLVLPHSDFALKIYPQLVVVDDLRSVKHNVLSLKNNVLGPINKFTVIQNLDQGHVDVQGFAASGYFGYRLLSLKSSQGISITPLSQSQNQLLWELQGSGCHTHENKTEFFTLDTNFDKNSANTTNNETLHLGNNKKQDWELVHRRCDLTEIMPLWFALGQQVDQFLSDHSKPSLFSVCQEVVESRQNDKIADAFINLYQAGFSGMLTPQLYDINHQGFALDPVVAATPLCLLSEGAQLIRSIFVNQKDQSVDLLRSLPPEFHCGRMKNVSLSGIGTLDLEWTKKTIRRMVLKATHSTEMELNLQGHVRQFRMRTREGLHGIVLPNHHVVTLQQGHTYLFDNFQ